MNLTHRIAALYQLLELDRPFCAGIVRESLRCMPADVSGPYGHSEEARLVGLVPFHNEPGLWADLEKAARRATPGFRMQLLYYARAYQDTPPAARRGALALHSNFLEDSATRDQAKDPERYDFFSAGYDYKVLSVRDYAALQMAWMLNLDVPVKPNRSAKEWADLRQRVRVAWSRERDVVPPKNTK